MLYIYDCVLAFFTLIFGHNNFTRAFLGFLDTLCQPIFCCCNWWITWYTQRLFFQMFFLNVWYCCSSTLTISIFSTFLFSINLSSQQQYVHCNFHLRSIHILLRCDCLLPFYCQTFCHNIVKRAQCDLPWYIFFTHIFNVNVLLHVTHTHSYSFSWRFWQLWFPEFHLHHLCLISFYTFLSSCSSSTFNLSSLFTSMAFSELSFILWTPNFHVHILLYF